MKLLMKYSVVLSLLSFIHCGPKNMSSGTMSATQWTHHIAEKMCKKMNSCMRSSLEKQPPEVRQMAEQRIVSVEKCIEDTNRDLEAPEDFVLSAEEISFAEKCVEEVEEIDCNRMSDQALQSCNNFGQALAQKMPH